MLRGVGTGAYLAARLNNYFPRLPACIQCKACQTWGRAAAKKSQICGFSGSRLAHGQGREQPAKTCQGEIARGGGGREGRGDVWEYLKWNQNQWQEAEVMDAYIANFGDSSAEQRWCALKTLLYLSGVKSGLGSFKNKIDVKFIIRK